MRPGGEEKELDLVMPLLESIAARAQDGTTCVAKIGDAGHYVKLIHSGIEQ